MFQNEVIKIIDENVQEVEELIQQKISIWFEHVLFTWQWWLGVILTILPWLFWIVIRKKNSTDRLLYVGLFVIVISVLLDMFGSQFGLWHYRYAVIPLIPTYLPWDFTLMPVTILFFLQIKPEINPWIKALIFAGLSSFVAEPILDWIQVYEPKKWEYFYSFPIQVGIYLLSHKISRRDKFLDIEP